MAKGRELRQQLPSAHSRKSLHTLMLLLELAIRANPRLERLAQDACRGRHGCVVLPPPVSTKSIPRALEKARVYTGRADLVSLGRVKRAA